MARAGGRRSGGGIPVRILVATDGSTGAETALDFVLDLSLSATDEIVVVGIPVYGTLYPIPELAGGAIFDAIGWEREYVRDLVARTAARIQGRGPRSRGLVVDGPVADGIASAAVQLSADLVAIGSRGLGRISGTVLGSVARQVARHSDVPVLVVRDRRVAPRRILVAVDGSADSLAAMRLLGALPLPRDTEITLLHVVPARSEVDDLARRDAELGRRLREIVARADRELAADALQHACRLIPAGRLVTTHTARGDAAEQLLLHAAEAGTDLIVLGSRGVTQGRFLQGSVADRVLGQAHCAVLVAKAPAGASAPDTRESASASR